MDQEQRQVRKLILIPPVLLVASVFYVWSAAPAFILSGALAGRAPTVVSAIRTIYVPAFRLGRTWPEVNEYQLGQIIWWSDQTGINPIASLSTPTRH